MGFVIRNSGEFNNSDLLKMRFAAFLCSKLECGSAVLNSNYAIHINAIEQIQRRYLKFMAFKEDKIYPPIGVPHQSFLTKLIHVYSIVLMYIW